MKFHVEMIVRDVFDPLSAVPVQKLIFAHLSKLLQSGKVMEHGIYSDERGGFLILEADSAEELHEMLSPIVDSMRIRAQPYVSLGTLKSFFDAYENTLKTT
ncbi:MAG: hypothetical protein ABR986_03245 [Methanomassiliicoccales archaeon]|jgi:hypothetical protein